MKKLQSFINKYDWVLPVIVAISGWGILAALFDFYYDLNDDVLIKDIISGIYTGTPSANNNQLMYPVSLIYVCLYKLIPAIPWFGMSEQLLFCVSFVMIGISLFRFMDRLWKKIVCIIVEVLVFSGCYLWELTMIQYTVVSGLLVTVAAVWLYSTPKDRLGDIKTFLSYNFPAIILCVIAFNIRSEMFLLLCPFIAMVGFCKWSEEKTKKENGEGILSKNNISKYCSVIVIIALLIGITLVIDCVAYSGDDWKAFRRMFDARTQVYDYTGVPDFDDNIDFYKANDIDFAEYSRIKDYNFALDEKIDASTLEAIAEYVNSGNASSNRTPRTIKENIWEYIYHATDFASKADSDLDNVFANDASEHSPMNLIIVILYVALIVVLFYRKDGRLWVKLPVMAICRSIPWIFAYSTQRVVTRITHPMYMMEIMVLLTMLAKEVSDASEGLSAGDLKKKINNISVVGISIIAVLMVSVLCVICISGSAAEISYKQDKRLENNQALNELKKYTNEHRDNYYYVDVYSTVNFTEKIYDDCQLSKVNQQLAGGWIYTSPLDEQKRNELNYSAEFFVSTKKEDANHVDTIGSNWFVYDMKDVKN